MLRLILVIVFIPALCFGAAPSDVLVKAQRAYQRGKYETTIKLVEPLLYPQLRLSRRKEVLQAHKLLGISHVFVKNNRAAEKEFLTILSMEPNYRFDSFVDPVVAVELFDAVKKRNAEILKRIVEREKWIRTINGVLAGEQSIQELPERRRPRLDGVVVLRTALCG